MKSRTVTLNNVCKSFVDDSGSSFQAVTDVNLHIEAGEFVTLLGPSGCGKTTTLRMVAGFESISTGDIYFGEDNVRNLQPNKRDCTMVFQSYALFPHMSVYDNVAYGLRLKKMPATAIRDKVNQTFDIMNLGDYQDRMPGQLSGGQQQRVALARALVMEPSVLLFDEPLSNLDAKLRLTMRDEIRRIQKAVGITAIYVTHDQSEAMSMSDKVVVMNKGRIEQVGTPTEVYQRPATRFVADFIGVANFLQAEVAATDNESVQLRLGEALVKMPSNGSFESGRQVTLVARPEAIGLTRPTAAGSGNLLPGRVQRSAFMGQVQDYWVDIGDNEIQVTVSNPRAHEPFQPGDKVLVDLHGDSLHWVQG